jgi:hypothetical protein
LEVIFSIVKHNNGIKWEIIMPEMIEIEDMTIFNIQVEEVNEATKIS